ncbi:MAG TPA: OmpA family protein [Chitinivibrionales bacterium]|nr:OmpA family protein [Chitinivibrionales bacterium]
MRLKRLALLPLFACLLIAVGTGGCQKKVTKVQQASPPVVEAPKPAPEAPVAPAPVDSTMFKEAALAGELQKQAKEALQDIYFDFDKSVIKSDGESRLTIIAKFMTDHPAMRILSAGNCDERGSEDYNLGLGQRRAQAAKDFLVNLGVSAGRIEVVSYGKDRLAVTGCTDESCHAKNRRDEFTVLQGLQPPLSER